MSIQMTSGKAYAGPGGLGYAYEPVCLYDTSDGMAFGPTFDDREEASAFLRWFEKRYDESVTIRYLKTFTAEQQRATADWWRAFLADHAEVECPYDGGNTPGFLSDRDASDGSGAWTPRCQCACHNKNRVEVLGGWAE